MGGFGLNMFKEIVGVRSKGKIEVKLDILAYLNFHYYHRRGGLYNNFLIVFKAGSPRSRFQPLWFLVRPPSCYVLICMDFPQYVCIEREGK